MITRDVDFCKNASNYFESYTIADDENDKKTNFYFICEKLEQMTVVP